MIGRNAVAAVQRLLVSVLLAGVFVSGLTSMAGAQGHQGFYPKTIQLKWASGLNGTVYTAAYSTPKDTVTIGSPWIADSLARTVAVVLTDAWHPTNSGAATTANYIFARVWFVIAKTPGTTQLLKAGSDTLHFAVEQSPENSTVSGPARWSVGDLAVKDLANNVFQTAVVGNIASLGDINAGAVAVDSLWTGSLLGNMNGLRITSLGYNAYLIPVFRIAVCGDLSAGTGAKIPGVRCFLTYLANVSLR